MKESLIPQLKLPEGVPENFIWRHGIVGDPAIARVLIKIGARIDRRVDLLRIEVIELGSGLGVLRGRLREAGE